MRKSALEEKFEKALEKGLESESAIERTAAIKACADKLSPALGELTARSKAAEERLEFEKTSRKETQSALDDANTELATLRPQIERGLAAEKELAELKSTNDQWKSEQVKLLTADAQAKLFKAEAAVRTANSTLSEAQSRFGQSGLQLLLDEVKKLITQHNISEPDAASLPAGISPMVLTLWGHSPIKAQFVLAYNKSFPEPSEGFRQSLLRVLLAGLPVYEGVPQSDPIDNRDVKLEVLTAMAQRWNVLSEIQRQFETIQAQRHGQFLRNNTMALAAQQSDLAVQGYGRDPIRVEEAQSITGYQGECIDPANCCCPKHNGVPAHLRQFEIPEAL